MKPLILTLCLMLSAGVLAQTADEAVAFLKNEAEFGHKAQAIGGNFTAVADDYSAIFWNPAGLTQLDKSEVHAAYQMRQDQNEISFLGNVRNDELNFHKLKSLGMAYKFPTVQGSFVMAFGYQQLYDYDDAVNFSGFGTQSNGLAFEVEDDQGQWMDASFDKDVFQTESVSTGGQLAAFSVGGGVMLSPSLSLGATVHFYQGNHLYDFSYAQDDSMNQYQSYPADFDWYAMDQSIETDLGGTGLTIGSMLNLSHDLRIGLAIDLPYCLKAEEIYSERESLGFDDGYTEDYEPVAGEWAYLIKYPTQLRCGACLNLTQFMLNAGFAYRDWQDVRFEVPDDYAYVEDYDYLMEENRVFKTDYRPVLSWHAGGEFRVLGSGFKLRGGYRVMPSVYQNADASWDRKYWSGGLAWDVDPFSTVHLTVVRGEWKRYSIDGLTQEGTLEQIQSDRVMAGLTFRLN